MTSPVQLRRLATLEQQRPSSEPPADLVDFWRSTLAQARGASRPRSSSLVDNGLELVTTHDVRFAGFAGDPIAAWLHRPADDRPVHGIIVRFLGYGSGRGLPHQISPWPLAGYAELVMDTRGQGGAWGHVGATPDPHGTGASHPGFMTRGIESPESYYYRRVYTDAVLAIDTACAIAGPTVPVIALGESQGGGIALAVAGLSETVTAVMADVPFLCDFPEALISASQGPVLDVGAYLGTHRWAEAEVLRTLSYVDAVHLGNLARVPGLISVALADPVCPPETVYAAINHYGGPVSTRVYPYNGHEGGQFHQQAEQLAWLREVLRPGH